MSTWLWVAVIIAVIALVIKRFIGEPLNARDVFGPPVLLVGLGVYSLTKLEMLNGTDITWLVIGSVVGIAFGALRGTTVKLYEREGELWQRYTKWTVLVWVVSVVVNAGIGFLGTAMGMHHEARPMTLSIGISLVGEMISIGLRAYKSGIPFAKRKDNGGGSSPLDRIVSDYRRRK